MAIITKPGSILKGSGATITLNKSQLAALAPVAADAYYSDSTNWFKVHIKYKSSTSSQFELLKFDATVASPEAEFLVSDKANDVFNVDYIDILDFDNGIFRVEDSSLNSSEFEIDMGSVTPPASFTYINYNINPFGYIVSPTGGVTSGSVPYGDDQFIKSSINESVGDFEYQWDFNWTGINAANMLLGITTSGGSLWYENLSCFEGTGVNTYRLWVGSSTGVVTGNLSAGNHTFKLVRTGTTLYYYLDNVLVYSGGSVSGTAQPTVRAYPSNVACTESKDF